MTHQLPPRERALNVPSIVLLFLMVFTAIHVLSGFVGDAEFTRMMLTFSFIPARFGGAGEAYTWPGGLAGDVWTFITYAFLHGDVMHLVTNSVWFVIFGSPVAWRFGPMRFMGFCAALAAGGAAGQLLTHWGSPLPMIGASGIVEGLMAGSLRFIFSPGGLFSEGFFARRNPEAAAMVPAMNLREVFQQPLALALMAFVFFTNAVASVFPDGIAWGTHIGGFFTGLLLFPLFDPAVHSRNLPPS